MSNYVAYYRVSTKKQGQSGLGLEAQKSTVSRFGGNIVAEFTEIESGKKARRPQLAAALQACKKHNATLIVAKLDRLARNVGFLAALMESGVEFVCCDMPSANKMVLHVMMALAEDEAERTSARTKAALAALKQRGVRLGSSRPGHWERINRQYGRNMRGWLGMDPEKRRAAKAAKLESSYRDAIPLIVTLIERGETCAQIAETLNLRGIKTPRGCSFSAASVHSIICRLKAVKS